MACDEKPELYLRRRGKKDTEAAENSEEFGRRVQQLPGLHDDPHGGHNVTSSTDIDVPGPEPRHVHSH